MGGLVQLVQLGSRLGCCRLLHGGGAKRSKGEGILRVIHVFFFFSFFIFQFFFSFDGIFCNASVVPRKFSHFRGLNSRVTNYYVHVQYVLRRAEV